MNFESRPGTGTRVSKTFQSSVMFDETARTTNESYIPRPQKTSPTYASTITFENHLSPKSQCHQNNNDAKLDTLTIRSSVVSQGNILNIGEKHAEPKFGKKVFPNTNVTNTQIELCPYSKRHYNNNQTTSLQLSSLIAHDSQSSKNSKIKNSVFEQSNNEGDCTRKSRKSFPEKDQHRNSYVHTLLPHQSNSPLKKKKSETDSSFVAGSRLINRKNESFSGKRVLHPPTESHAIFPNEEIGANGFAKPSHLRNSRNSLGLTTAQEEFSKKKIEVNEIPKGYHVGHRGITRDFNATSPEFAKIH